MATCSIVELGETALLRSVYDGHIGAAMPVNVVEDSSSRVVLLLRAGAPIAWPAVWPIQEWIAAGFPLERRTWQEHDRLFIYPLGRRHSVSLFWRAEDGTHRDWYIDAIDPLRRTDLGWDTWDQELDVVIAPDLSSWHWKDEAEFDDRVALGLLSRADADALRNELRVVVTDAEAGRSVFAEPWPTWRPDPSWPRPSLDDGWDAMPEPSTTT